jgi:hypothetical protein
MTARLMRACRALAAALLVAPASAARAADQAEPALTADAAEPRKAAGDSLLFSHRAERLIEEARLGHGRTPAVAATSRGVRGPPAAAPPATIHLSAIVYHAPDDWRVWLNGQSYTPAAQPRAIEILEVTADAVRLTWRGGSEQRPRQVELQPNQSYLIASGEIIEGKLRRRLPALSSSPPAWEPRR